MLPAKPAREEEDPECGRDFSRGRGASSPQGGVGVGMCRCQPDFHLLLWMHTKDAEMPIEEVGLGGGRGGDKMKR